MSYRANEREVARSALNQQELNFSSDWSIHNKTIITFHDLNNSHLPLAKIVDAPIDELAPKDFFSINDDYKNVFKGLIKFCVQQHLYKLGYEWQPEETLFRVIAPNVLEDKLEIKQGWEADKKATRTIFKSNYYEKFNVFYCQHFAFSIDIKEFDNEWFLCINPTWTVSINGKRKSQVQPVLYCSCFGRCGYQTTSCLCRIWILFS